MALWIASPVSEKIVFIRMQFDEVLVFKLKHTNLVKFEVLVLDVLTVKSRLGLAAVAIYHIIR